MGAILRHGTDSGSAGSSLSLTQGSRRYQNDLGLGLVQHILGLHDHLSLCLALLRRAEIIQPDVGLLIDRRGVGLRGSTGRHGVVPFAFSDYRKISRAVQIASLLGNRARAGGPSSQPSSITAAALRVCEPGQGVDRGTAIGVRIQPDSPRRADTAPVANEERAAEQVWPNGEAVIPLLIPFGVDADE